MTQRNGRRTISSAGCVFVVPLVFGAPTPNSDAEEWCSFDIPLRHRSSVKLRHRTGAEKYSTLYFSVGANGMTNRQEVKVQTRVAPVDFRCVTGTDPLANAGQITASNNTACNCPNLKRPISVVAWDEQADTSIVPYAGGQTPQLATDCPPGGSCVGIGFTSAQVNAQTWADFSTCTGSATTDPDNSLCKTWTSCQGNRTVSLCSTTSGGHLAVYSNASAKWTDMAWNKLKTQSLP